MRTDDSFLEDLNEEQREVILSEDECLLVLAGAGSGKTRLLTRLVAKKSLDSEVLALTFTNKAAREMKERVTALGAHAHLSTFHSFCYYFLRRYAGFPDHRVIDQTHAQNIVKEVLTSDLLPPSAVYRALSMAKEKPNPDFGEHSAVAAAYRERLDAESLWDFGDLLQVALRELETQAKNLPYTYILVDEFQDTNAIQFEILRLLDYGRRRIAVVGDEDQSIYSFRGAEPRNIDNYRRAFAPKEFRLTYNYRSSARILEAATAVINKGGSGKILRPVRGRGEKLAAAIFDSDIEEKHFLAGEISKLIASGYRPNDIAIFYRINKLSSVYEEGLIRRSIPYRILGAIRFFEREEVRDFVARLELAAGVGTWESLKRFVARPRRGIGPKTLLELRETITPRLESLKTARLKKFIESRDEILELAETLRKTPAEFLEKMLNLSYGKHLETQPVEEREGRYGNLVELMRNFKILHGYNALNFLDECTLHAGERVQGDGGVSLLTVHLSKGLEWKVVFLAGAEEGLFPHQNSIDTDKEHEERRLFYVAMTRAKEKLYISAASRRMLWGRVMERIVSRYLLDIPESLVAWSQGREWRRRETFPLPAAPGLRASIPPGDGKNSAPTRSYRIGDRISHPTYGQGKVIGISGIPPTDKVRIAFREAGIRIIAAGFHLMKKI